MLPDPFAPMLPANLDAEIIPHCAGGSMGIATISEHA